MSFTKHYLIPNSVGTDKDKEMDRDVEIKKNNFKITKNIHQNIICYHCHVVELSGFIISFRLLCIP